LKAAGLRDGRLHDARHTAATVPLLLGVPERTVMVVMGWFNIAMTARYRYRYRALTRTIRRDVAQRVGGPSAAPWSGQNPQLRLEARLDSTNAGPLGGSGPAFALAR
jgi:hypothetical protein